MIPGPDSLSRHVDASSVLLPGVGGDHHLLRGSDVVGVGRLRLGNASGSNATSVDVLVGRVLFRPNST